MTAAPVRGQVYRADLGYGAKPWLIVSNNQRNRVTADVLAVRLTTIARELPTWVPLGADDPLGGYVNTDNIETLGKDELGDYLGTLSPSSIVSVNRALAVALGIP
ncbi:type II toxin-antitoxin system PemK/MazF family toxin [Nocardia flavorosea]|uniref:Type II toxin-antitoxin system PemK/MazF family toxin n=1 Tax=Nocardia flavorosea TaxID=53429 RepID=A0A846Y8K3_9NOCA|nr:type II toxin-antitoxin system PemK/MazF family toxin [Nocardia flavorosea]NKY55493.1 type II toxin-antitoxin system PemK/MazF family toxin [Nocardia flavorosea]